MTSESVEDLSITLPAEMGRIICERVASGSYASASDLVREAMTLWIQQMRRLDALDAAIERGVAELDARCGDDAEVVRRELLAELRSRGSG